MSNDPQQLQNQISHSDTLITIAQKLAHQKTDAIIETTNAIDEQNLKNIVDLFINAATYSTGWFWSFRRNR